MIEFLYEQIELKPYLTHFSQIKIVAKNNNIARAKINIIYPLQLNNTPFKWYNRIPDEKTMK